MVRHVLIWQFKDEMSADEKAAMLEASKINLCVECGCCTFVCPANRPLMENIRIAKGFLKEHNAHKANLK